jgi:hypothetical protein
MLWQSLTPVGTFCDLKHNDFLFVIITSTSDGIQPFLKQDKGEVLHEPKKLRYYRSYKTFDIENFNDDIEQIKINQTCHEVDSVYNEYEYL